MTRAVIFPDTDEGTLLFSRALQAWKRSGRSIEAFFGAEYGIAESTVHNTAKRLGVKIPTNRQHDRVAIVDEQRAGSVPPPIILARYGIAMPTLRDWASAQGKRLRGNTKHQRAAWWRAYFAGFDLNTAFTTFRTDRIAPHVAIAAYHAHIAPDHPVYWDASEHPAVVTTDMDAEDFAEVVMASEPVPPEQATIFIGLGTTLHAIRWAEIAPPEPEQPDPDVITLDGTPVRPGDHVVLTTKTGHRHAVEYLGLQHNGLARTKDLATNTRRTTTTNALEPA